jgi:hypothetical protein
VPPPLGTNPCDGLRPFGGAGAQTVQAERCPVGSSVVSRELAKQQMG